MGLSQFDLAREIRDLSGKIAQEGWDRLRALRLIQAANSASQLGQDKEWWEVTGRAASLADVLGEFVRDTPSTDRLAGALHFAQALADLLETGVCQHLIDQQNLPATPGEWTFVLVEDGKTNNAHLEAQLKSLGFIVTHVSPAEEPMGICDAGPSVILAPSDWVHQHSARCLQQANHQNKHCFFAAVATDDDFRSHIQTLQAGAHILLDHPVDLTRLLSELAGLAWMPRAPYRTLLVDDETSVLSLYTDILERAGISVLSSSDPVAAKDFMEEFSPEVCILDMEMPACRGTDLAALLRRSSRFAELPMIFLSGFDDAGHRLDARHAGGNDFLTKPADSRLLVAAVIARARQFRNLELARTQRRESMLHLTQLQRALDAHAIVSKASADGAILAVNQKFCDISGYRQEELIGHSHRVVKSGHHEPGFFQEMWRTISRGEIWQGEVQNRTKSGQPYWVQATIVPIPPTPGQGSASRQYLSIRTDISEHKRVQAEMNRRGRLLDLLRQVLEQLSHGQSLHEIGNLLLEGITLLTHSAFGFIGAVQQDDEGRPYLDAHALTNRSSHMVVPPHQGAAVSMQFRNLDSLYGAVLTSGKTVICNDPTSDTRCTQLPAGHLAISTFLGLPVHHGERLIGMIGLANRADGYDDSVVEFLQPIVTAYGYILQAAQLREFHRQLVGDMLHRRTQAHSPIQDKPAHNEPTQATPGSILVAKEEPGKQATLRMQLEALGQQVNIVGDGAQALNQYQSATPALILLDLKLPTMDGLALARAIRAREKESSIHVPIIAIIGDQDLQTSRQCLAAGMDDFLFEPVEISALSNLLSRWLPPEHTAASTILSRNGGLNPKRPSQSTLDLDYLTHIVGQIAGADIRKLLDTFTAVATAELAVCQRHPTKTTSHTLAQAMHKLKSSARMVGALRFAELAETLEQAAKREQREAFPSLLNDLAQALADIEAAAALVAASTEGGNNLERPSPEYLPRLTLLVDDDPVARRQMNMLLSSLGIDEVITVDSVTAALTEMGRAEQDVDLIVTDLNMPETDGIEFLRQLANDRYSGQLLIFSGVEDRLLQTAGEFVRAKGMNLLGALKKPVTRDALFRLLTASQSKPKRPGTGPSLPLSPEDIRAGIRLDEFDIHFQPKVNAATLQVVGVEALARWRHQGRPIPPDIFIAIAEKHGLISELSTLLVSKSLIGGARLLEAGFPLYLAVNISANWLDDIYLPEFILSSAQASGFPAERLILEITETGVMSDAATALDVLTRLRLKGFKLSIDDFGIGYSSIDQLQRLPFSELKLDRSFVNGAAEKYASRAILASSVEMAMKLGLSTVAEGVETQADLDLVRGLGCDLVQGWLIAKAMPLDELITWLQARSA